MTCPAINLSICARDSKASGLFQVDFRCRNIRSSSNMSKLLLEDPIQESSQVGVHNLFFCFKFSREL